MEQELKNKFEADYYAIVGTYPDHCVLEYMQSGYTLAKSEDSERIKELEFIVEQQKELIKDYDIQFSEGDGWVKCSDRLPDIQGKYNVYIPLTDSIEIMAYIFTGQKWEWVNFNGYAVTHWQPLPQPPKQ